MSRHILNTRVNYCPECYRIRLPAYWHTFTLPAAGRTCEQTPAADSKGGAA